MRKILAAMLLMLFSFFAVSCSSCKGGEHTHGGDDSYYYELGFHYELPESFVFEEKLPYGDRVFKDDKSAYFYFNAFDGEELEEDWLVSSDVGVREFTSVIFSGLPFPVEYEYRESDDSTHFDYVYEYPEGEEHENEYYRYMVVRTSEYMYVITLVCNANDKDSYKETFDSIINSVKLDEKLLGQK